MKHRLPINDRFVTSSLLFAGLVVGGFVAIFLGWRTAAATLTVPFQVPAFVSGGLGGLALIAIGVGCLHIQFARQAAADDQAELDDVLDKAEALLATIRERS